MHGAVSLYDRQRINSIAELLTSTGLKFVLPSSFSAAFASAGPAIRATDITQQVSGSITFNL